jgi:hypothetical protein
MPHAGYEFLAHIIMPTFSACSAVMAFEFMRFCKIDAYPKDTGVISWRTVLFGGGCLNYKLIRLFLVIFWFF